MVDPKSKSEISQSRLSLPDFSEGVSIFQGRQYIIYKVERKSDRQQFWLKTSLAQFPLAQDLDALNREFKLGCSLKSDYLPKYLEKIESGNRVFLLMEALQGEAFSPESSPKLEKKLKFSAACLELLGLFETKQVLFNNLRSNQFFYDESNQQFVFLGLGQDRRNLKEQQFHFMSPEETGRSNWPEGPWSDQYALGVGLYELFTGQLPFESEDALELIHSHTARVPIPPSRINPNLPDSVSGVLLRMLAKPPQERYNSAKGVLKDFQHILHHWEQGLSLTNFKSGGFDPLNNIRIPQILVGREKAIEQIRAHIYSQNPRNKKITFLLTGQAGIGKTAMAVGIKKLIQSAGGIFGYGKQLTTPSSYGETGLIQSLRNVLYQILRLESQELELKKLKIQSHLRENLGIFNPDFPEWASLFPTPPLLPSLSLTESQMRFRYALKALIKALSSHLKPLILMLDDLQFTELNALKTIAFLAASQDLPHFSLVLTFRQNDIAQNSPVAEFLDHLQEIDNCQQADLLPLDLRPIEEYLNVILGNNSQNSVLAGSCLTKTRGIPGFLNQFLKQADQNNYFQYSTEKSFWVYQVESLDGVPIPEGLAELIQNQVRKLNHEVKTILSQAAVIGFQFDLASLESISGFGSEQIRQSIETGLENGILNHYLTQGEVLNQDYDFQFSHRNLHQYLYQFLPEKNLLELHYQTGKLQWSSPDSFSFPIRQRFKILNHFAKGKIWIQEPSERNQVIEMCLQASEQALASTEGESARRFLSLAFDLLKGANLLGSPIGTRVRFQLGKSYAVLGAYQKAELIFRKLIEENRGQVFELKVVYELSELLIADGNHRETLELGYATIGRFKLEKKLPQKKASVKRALIKEILKIKVKFRSSRIPGLANLPLAKGEVQEWIQAIYHQLIVSALNINPELFALIVARSAQLPLKHGLSSKAPSTFMSFAIMNLIGMRDYSLALQLGHLALDLGDTMTNSQKNQEISFPYVHFLMHLEKNIRLELPRFLEVHQSLIALGRPTFAGYVLNSRVWSMDTLGISLEQIESESEQYLNEFISRNEQEVLAMILPKFLLVKALRGGQAGLQNLSHPDYNPTLIKAELEQKGASSILGGWYMAEMELNWLNQNYEAGLESYLNVIPILTQLEGLYFTSDLYLFGVLNLLGSFMQGNKRNSKLRKNVNKNFKTLKRLKQQQAENYTSVCSIVQASLSFLDGKRNKAIAEIKVAIEISRNKFTRNYAIGNEILASMLQAQGKPAADSLQDSRQGYLIWGATAKVTQMTAQHPELQTTKSLLLSSKSKEIGFANQLDLASILKASRALSSQIRLSSLLQELLRILLENLGFQKASFIMLNQQNPVLEISGEVLESEIHFHEPQKAPEAEDLPLSLTQFVQNSRRRKFLSQPANSEFSSDPYFTKTVPYTALCHPIIHKNQLLGLIYMENQLVSQSIPEERLRMLDVLSGQIGVSLDNALLYATLEMKVAERTQKIEAQKKLIESEKAKSDDLLLNILPEHVVHELKETGRTKARSHAKVSILFSDIVGFTQFAETQSPEDLVSKLDRYFGICDEISSKYGLEKIKTIGDAYMCVAGLSGWNPFSTVHMVEAALEMLEATQALSSGGNKLQVRIGIHTGPVVAGVVGSNKFAYDIWGDSVVIAARMENSGGAGEVNLSQETYDLVKNFFKCEYRGMIKAKNKGDLPMYYVSRKK